MYRLKRLLQLNFGIFFFGLTTIILLQILLEYSDERRLKKIEFQKSEFENTNDRIHNKKLQNLDKYVTVAAKKINKKNLVEITPYSDPLIDDVIFPKSIVHFDLKGAPPKLHILKKRLDFVKSYGAFGVLMEYEDMFPWSVKLSKVKSKNAYKISDVIEILQHAKKIKLEVIPLVQTFGHMEFILKHKKFIKYRRSVGMDVRSLSPFNKNSVLLVKNMINQVLLLHLDIKWIHLGSDEVFQLGECKNCDRVKHNKEKLYLKHMLPILRYVSKRRNVRNQTIKPIIWDDMVRNFSVFSLKKLSKFSDLMIWDYSGDLNEVSSQHLWSKYRRVFPSVWITGAFKGADKPDSNFPNPYGRVKNFIAWIKRASELERDGLQINGFVLTGWSRFDHFRPLCELFSSGMPLLALFLSMGKLKTLNVTAINSKISKELGFEISFRFYEKDLSKMDIKKGTFTEWQIFYAMGLLEKLTQTCDLRHGPNSLALSKKLEEGKQFLANCKSSLISLSEQYLKVYLPMFYFNDTINEIVKTKILKPVQSIEKALHRMEYYKKIGLIL